MKLGDIIRAQKTDVIITGWQSGKIAKRFFPLSRAKGGISLGQNWCWRVVTFRALGHAFRVLIKLNEQTEYFASILAIDLSGDSAILCHHELHTSHKGWHCHYVKGEALQTYPGVWRDTQKMVSWPTFARDECEITFNVTRANALTIAASRYRFVAQGELI
ncbi:MULTISPECIES: hypothetical protein [Rhodomicrobium]|uniref:hypothetical protein n=1 Tax=Rhodomicrobium TaxID=1068 RepID=UPI000F73CA8A|nr:MULTISPECIES: hypothetical protein [Rhodomicrobium]